MAISLQADATLPQGYILVDGQRVASFSTTGGLSATLAANTVTTSSLVSGSVTTEKIVDSGVTFNKITQSSGAFSFRNKLINGNFDIWQRGVTFTAPAHLSMTADRWQFLKFTGNASSVARQPFTIGQTDVPNSPEFYLRTTVTTPGDICIGQRIEGVETLAGKTATYSFWIRAQNNTTLNQVLFEQMFGTGGGGSPVVNFNGSANAPVTTSWTRITGTVNVPNINSKTKGANPDDYLALRIDIDETYTGWFDIAQFQLEEGPIATPFEQRPVGTEIALCQRYYEVVRSYWTGNTAASTAYGNLTMFLVEKRTTPNRESTISSGTAGNGGAGTRTIADFRTNCIVVNSTFASALNSGGWYDVYGIAAEL